MFKDVIHHDNVELSVATEILRRPITHIDAMPLPHSLANSF